LFIKENNPREKLSKEVELNNPPRGWEVLPFLKGDFCTDREVIDSVFSSIRFERLSD